MQTIRILVSMLIFTGTFLVSCEKFLGPDTDNHDTESRIFKDAAYAEGILLNGYDGLPDFYKLDDVATDDAITNTKTSGYLRMATGEWSSQFDPMSVWSTAYAKLYYLNYFLSIVNNIEWATDKLVGSVPKRQALFVQRFTGEALALRAWYNFELLRNHGGIGADGTALGFIIFESVPDRNASYDIPRSSYDECTRFILDDLNKAISLLPNVYADNGTDLEYNMVFGNNSDKNKNRINGLFAKALKSRVSLFVASQSFNTSALKWDSAAVAAATLLTPAGGGINGINDLSSNGISFYEYNKDDKEILFRRDYSYGNAIEADNFPPSRFGNGQTNPSQNLVDAFPMSNGYPITNALSGYDPDNPYDGRDSRLQAYIVYNGNDLDGNVVNTNAEDPKDGLNQTIKSTRSGYYLKKLLIPWVNLDPEYMSEEQHYYTIFRFTEMFLNYAEAANEAWGPDADPMGYGFTPRTIIKAIRERAGIDESDPYLASLTTSSEMRTLIRNERRIELCFEGFRFWDMRRWNLDLTENVNGMSIKNNIYTKIAVEDRLYKPFMNYGPIPLQETLKDKQIIQNQGW